MRLGYLLPFRLVWFGGLVSCLFHIVFKWGHLWKRFSKISSWCSKICDFPKKYGLNFYNAQIFTKENELLSLPAFDGGVGGGAAGLNGDALSTASSFDFRRNNRPAASASSLTTFSSYPPKKDTLVWQYQSTDVLLCLRKSLYNDCCNSNCSFQQNRISSTQVIISSLKYPRCICSPFMFHRF